MNEIGKTIKARLKELGKTQGWLAEVANVSNTAVSQWIKKGTIARENATVVAGLLGITVDALIKGDQAPGDPRDSRSDLVAVDPIQRRILSLYSRADDRGKLEMLASLEEISKNIEDGRRKAESKGHQLGLVEPAPSARHK